MSVEAEAIRAALDGTPDSYVAVAARDLAPVCASVRDRCEHAAALLPVAVEAAAVPGPGRILSVPRTHLTAVLAAVEDGKKRVSERDRTV
jgi:hypothetical protein